MFDAATQYNRIIIKSKSKESDDCAICLAQLTGKTCAYLPCTHLFHNSCLHQAFQQKLYTCPLCRYDLMEALKKTNYIFPIADRLSTDASYFDDDNHHIYMMVSYTNVPLDNELIPDLVISDMEENSTIMDQLYRWTDILNHIMQDM